MKLVPVIYAKCGHSINVIGGAEADPDGAMLAEFERTGQPVVVHFNGGKCWNCDGTWDKRPAIVNPPPRKYTEEI